MVGGGLSVGPLAWGAHVSLLRGPLPVIVAGAAAASLAASVRGRARRRPWLLVALASGAVVVVVAVGAAVGIENRVGSSFPRSFYLWAALPVFAALVAATGWRSPG